jgi:trk/ktr system potassium uptake protein
MHIIILGAGQTGGSLAANLVLEHNVTLIDLNEERLNELQKQYDLRTVHGHGAHPHILALAGAAKADILIALGSEDETNITACLVAATQFNIPLKIARVRAGEYFLDGNQFFAGNQSPIDIFINPATLITHNILHLLEYPGALRVFDFGEEQFKLIATKLLPDSALTGKTAAKLTECLPNIPAKIIAIYRNNQFMPLETTSLKIEDDILFISESNSVNAVLNILRPGTAFLKLKRVMIIGGGYIGSQLAQNLQTHYQIKLIEQNQERCEQLARTLTNTLVLHGNGCDSSLLRNEDVDNIDCFCALSNSDADNIVSALYSKQLGAKLAIALVNRDAYLSLIISGYAQVDIALSPQQITLSAILRHLRHKQVMQAHSLRRGAAEALEIAVFPQAAAAGKKIADLHLPQGAHISAIIRNKTLLFPAADTSIQTEDRIIVFLSDKKTVSVIKNLFIGDNGKCE